VAGMGKTQHKITRKTADSQGFLGGKTGGTAGVYCNPVPQAAGEYWFYVARVLNPGGGLTTLLDECRGTMNS